MNQIHALSIHSLIMKSKKNPGLLIRQTVLIRNEIRFKNIASVY